MWSFRAWRRRRLLARHPVAEELWQRVRRHLPILDGLDADEDRACASGPCCFSPTST